jgi:hypothetical protein
VVFVAGDRAVATQIRELLGPIGAVAVNENVYNALTDPRLLSGREQLCVLAISRFFQLCRRNEAQ